MDSFIRQAKAISDPTRLRMLKLIEGGELCVCEIMAVLGLGQSTASKHLGILKTAGLIERRKNGTWSYYRLNRNTDGHNRDFLRYLKARLNGDRTILKDKKLLNKTERSRCSAKEEQTHP